MADLYDGIVGLTAAWERWRYWINVELPDQWQQLQALYAQLGGSGAQSEITSTLTTAPGPYDIRSLSAADQQRVREIQSGWAAAFAAGTLRISLGTRSGFTGAPSVTLIAAVDGGFPVGIALTDVYVYPVGTVLQSSATGGPWIPGQDRWW